MAIRTSSRRRLVRRSHSSDMQEDTTVRTRIENSDSEKRPQRAPDKESKKERKPSVPDTNLLDDANDESEDEQIDVTHFKDQPLRKIDVMKLEGLSKDWKEIAHKITQNGVGINDIASSLAEFSEDSNGQKALDRLEKIMRNLIDVCAEMHEHSESINDIRQKVAQGVEISDAKDRYVEGADKRVTEYKNQTSRQKYSKSAIYHEFHSAIYEVQNSPMPPINEIIPKEDGDESEDEELEVGGVTQVYTCPITLTPLVNPLTSTVCGHSFSADAIKDMFRNARSLQKCPSTGCAKMFNLGDCKPNVNLAKKVKAWQRRQERVAQNSDEEEVVE